MAKYCTSCGSQIEENAKFCQNCGSPQDDNEFVNYGNSKSTNVTGSVNNGTGSRSKIAAGLLGVFLGGWGIKLLLQLLLVVLEQYGDLLKEF